MKSFPIFLTVENKSIVVFGGGADAAAKLGWSKRRMLAYLLSLSTLIPVC